MYGRSFGDNPEQIIELARICIEEQRKSGVSSCLKHFPGHGFTTTDSHKELPTIHQSMEDWMKNEGYIFKRLINECAPEYIMVGHLLYPAVDDKPASISAKWIDILRNQLGYKGKVISDSIIMKALSQDLTEGNFSEAGLDIILTPRIA